MLYWSWRLEQGREVQKKMECPPRSWDTRWETYRHEEAKEIWESILQLQGLLGKCWGYRFLWVDVGSSGSSSDAHIFNCITLRKNIEDGTLGLSPSYHPPDFLPLPLLSLLFLCLFPLSLFFLLPPHLYASSCISQLKLCRVYLWEPRSFSPIL